MSKVKFIFCIFTLILLFLPNIILAVEYRWEDNAEDYITSDDIESRLQNQTDTLRDDMNLSEDSVTEVITRVLTYILGTVGVLAVACIIIAGIMYITAAGDEDRIKTAKQTFIYSAIGLGIVLLALTIVTTINYLIGS